jgi:hypothetical protein
VAGWSGQAADEFAAQWSAAVSQVDQISGRLAASADYATAIAGWMGTTRRALAGAVAECLGSREAATVRLAGPGGGAGAEPDAGVSLAAASIAAHVLAAVLEAVDAGYALHGRWAGRLDELGAPVVTPVSSGGAPTVIEF